MSNSKGVRNTVIVLILVMIASVAGVVHKIMTPQLLSTEELAKHGIIYFDAPREIRPFKLNNQDGKIADNSVFEGKWSLVFFGFTHCPDVCPTTLSDLARFHMKLPDSLKSKIQIVFVTLDPARDDSASMKKYLHYFDPSFIGLEGDFLETMKFARNLNVAFNKVQLAGGDYTIDHSANIIIVNPRGQYQGFLNLRKDPQVTLKILGEQLSHLR